MRQLFRKEAPVSLLVAFLVACSGEKTYYEPPVDTAPGDSGGEAGGEPISLTFTDYAAPSSAVWWAPVSDGTRLYTARTDLHLRPDPGGREAPQRDGRGRRRDPEHAAPVDAPRTDVSEGETGREPHRFRRPAVRAEDHEARVREPEAATSPGRHRDDAQERVPRGAQILTHEGLRQVVAGRVETRAIRDGCPPDGTARCRVV